MPKAIVSYMAIIALAVAGTVFITKTTASPAIKAKNALQLNLEARKQALAEI